MHRLRELSQDANIDTQKRCDLQKGAGNVFAWVRNAKLLQMSLLYAFFHTGEKKYLGVRGEVTSADYPSWWCWSHFPASRSEVNTPPAAGEYA